MENNLKSVGNTGLSVGRGTGGLSMPQWIRNNE